MSIEQVVRPPWIRIAAGTSVRPGEAAVQPRRVFVQVIAGALVVLAAVALVGVVASRRLAEAEADVEGFCLDQGVAWTLLRPTLIYDEGRDGNVSRLAGLIRRFGMLPLSGDGQGLRQPVHAEDLALGALAAAAAPAAENRAYDLVGGETLTYHAMATRVFEGLGRRPVVFCLPPALFALMLQAAAPWLPGATAAMGARMGQDLTFDSGDARRDFGWAPRDFHPRF